MNNTQLQPSPYPELEVLRQRARQSTDKVERVRLKQEWVNLAGKLAAQDEGRIKQLETQRVQEYGCPTDDLALAMVRELEGDVATLEVELNEGVETLMGEMGWL